MERSGHLLPLPQSPDGLELRHLRALVFVADELNYSRAADRLCISAPALSRQIQSLERHVGAQLLIRTPHGVRLTTAGDALLPRARTLLRDVDEAVHAAQAASDQLLARAGRLLEPVVGLIKRSDGLEEARGEFETLMSHAPRPEGTAVRPVSAAGTQSLVVSPPVSEEPTVLYLHGGAYVLGSAYGYQAQAGALALAAHAGVLLPDYRLAPEHPFPAALDDAVNAYRWLLARGVAPGAIAVAGDSSGAGLALSLALRLRQESIPLPGAMVLFCPWIDLHRPTLTPGTGVRALATTADETDWCARAYLGSHSAHDPLVDPLGADLSDMPAMLIQAATGDARIAEARALTAHARRCGVDARFDVYPADVHAFQAFWSFLPEAAEAIEVAGAFIRARSGRVPAAAVQHEFRQPALPRNGPAGDRGGETARESR